MRFLAPDDLLSVSAGELAASRELTVAFVAGELRGEVLAAALHCHWLAIEEGSTMVIDSPEAWSGAVGRLGSRAFRLYLLGRTTLNADDAVREGLADVLVPSGADPVEWFADWTGGRSSLALDTAAALIRGHGGDTAERAAFARLFATGEPQEGLAAFLEKRKPTWT